MPVDQGICHIFCVRLFLRNLAPEDLHYQIIPKAVERISGRSPKNGKNSQKMLKKWPKIAENSHTFLPMLGWKSGDSRKRKKNSYTRINIIFKFEKLVLTDRRVTFIDQFR